MQVILTYNLLATDGCTCDVSCLVYSLFKAYSQCSPPEKRPLLLENIKYGRRNRFVFYKIFVKLYCFPNPLLWVLAN